MFIGAIRQELRDILLDHTPAFAGKDVFVGCSGNFTVERTLSQSKHGIKSITGCDVSLYTSLVGATLTDQPFRLEIKSDEHRWLEEYLEKGGRVGQIATVLLCTSMFENDSKNSAYCKRMKTAYTKQFPEMWERSVKKVEQAIQGVRIDNYYPMDVMKYIDEVAHRDGVFISFPPTYSGGYEKLYQKIDSTFDWDAPQYEMFTK